MNNIEKIFTDIYDKNKWGCKESRSGPGSRVSVNERLLRLLENFVESNKIQTIIDCGCGDFNWMKLFNFSLVKNYLGIDIVQSLIKSNSEKFSNKIVTFEKKCIVNENVPNCDLIICKDILFHLNFDDALKVLNKFKNQTKYLLSTTFTGYKNTNINTGGWRPINLQSHPFNLEIPYIYWENIEDKKGSFSSKSIGIWRFN